MRGVNIISKFPFLLNPRIAGDPLGFTPRRARCQVAIGTTGYMPAEQIKGDPKLGSDVYAIGMLAIQALTGIMPDELQTDIKTGDVIWKNHVSVSRELAKILDRMVRENWPDRFPSASEALSALQAIASPPPTVISRKPRSPIAYKLIIVVMGLMALGAIGLTIYLSYNQPETTPTPEEEICGNNPCVW